MNLESKNKLLSFKSSWFLWKMWCRCHFWWSPNRYLDNPSLTQSFYHGASHREVTKCSLCRQPSVFFATWTKPTFLSRRLKNVMKKKLKTIARTWNRKQVELCLKGTPVMVKRKFVLWQKTTSAEAGESACLKCVLGQLCKSCLLPQEAEPLHCGNNNWLLDWSFLLKTWTAHNISSTRTCHCWSH